MTIGGSRLLGESRPLAYRDLIDRSRWHSGFNVVFFAAQRRRDLPVLRADTSGAIRYEHVHAILPLTDDVPAAKLGNLVRFWDFGKRNSTHKIDRVALLFLGSDAKESNDRVAFPEILAHGHLNDIPGLESETVV